MISRTVRVAGLAMGILLVAAACQPIATTGSPAATDRIDAVAFHADMRKLWEDHVTWTRLYIVSAVAGLPDTGPTANRLLQNQADIGNAIVPFYGRAAGDQLTALLRDHILTAAALVAAAKAGDANAVVIQKNLWYANANQIADFLAAANPAWPDADMRQMMKMHLDQTLDEATARLKGDYPADIAAYDAIHLHILDMADMLADGIVTQFPNRFTAS
jgi:acyl-coenzyme A synthetase/AMP-(fatty) acid ligase